MKKRILAVLMAALVLSSLVGCGNEPDPAGVSSDSSGAEQTLDWPNSTIQINIPYGAGGDSDTNCRIAAKYLEEELGTTVVCVNMPGANSTLGPLAVLDAEADGNTLYYYNSAQATNQATGIFKDAGFDMFDDFVAAGTCAYDGSYALVCSASSGWKTLDDMIAAAKAAPGTITYSYSYGTNVHYLLLGLEESLDIDLDEIDIGSDNSAKIVSMLSGEVDLITGNLSTFEDYLEDGSMVCLGLFCEERNEYYPDYPALSEYGVNAICPKYYEFRFKAGTDERIVAKFNAALQAVCANPNYQEELAVYRASAICLTPEEQNSFDESYVNDQHEALKDLA